MVKELWVELSDLGLKFRLLSDIIATDGSLDTIVR